MLQRAMVEQFEVRRLLATVHVDLDFGDEGVVAAPAARFVEVVPDGGVLSTDYFGNARLFDADGATLWTSDAPNATAEARVTASGDHVFRVTVRQVASDVGNTRYELEALRLRDGQRDYSFGNAGFLIYNPAGQRTEIRATSIIATPDGGVIFSVGSVGANAQSLVIKADSDGRLDAGFAHDGVLKLDWEAYPVLAPAGDGKFLLARSDLSEYNKTRSGLFRYRADGTLDTTFGDNGLAAGVVADEILVADDGKIIIYDYTTGENTDGTSVGRLKPDGSVDRSFADGGFFYVARQLTYRVGVDARGRVVRLILPENAPASAAPKVFRLDVDGKFDSSFGDDGRVDLGLSDATSFALAVNSDDEVLVALNGLRRLTETEPVQLFASGRLDVNGTNDDDVIRVDADGDDLVVTFNGAVKRFAANAARSIVVDGFGGDDLIVSAANPKATLRGGAGNDRLYGGDSADHIYGGGGNDTIAGAAGSDSLYGEKDDDRIEGGSGNDSISGSGGDDVLHGIAGRDRIDGGSGGDEIDGGGSNDTLTGGDGPDTLSGGSGDDTFYLNDSTGNDVAYGAGGRDTADAKRRDRLTSIEQLL